MKTFVQLLVLLGCMAGLGGNSARAWQADNGDGTFKNPVLYADYPDPDIIRVTNDFYMVSTTFADSPGVNVLHSKDLVNWEMVSHVATNLDWSAIYNLAGGTAYRQGFWASSLRYYNGTFYVLTDPVGTNSRMYYATNAAGPWQYYPLNQSLYDPGFLIDSNGTGYVFFGYSPQQSVAILNANFSQIVSVSNHVVLSGGEGSHAVRVGSYYYLFNANPGVWPYQLRCSRATNLFGPWETNHVCLAETSGGHQGGIVDLDNTGTNWYGFVHQDSGAVGRMTRIGPVYWANNWPVFGTTTASNQMAGSYAKPVLGQTLMQPATSDEFTNPALGLQWQWNHNPDNTKWSLTARPGWLRLLPTQATNFWVARNTLTQKGQGPWSRGEVSLDVSHLQPGDLCGLGTLGTTNGQIAVNCDRYGNNYLSMNLVVPTTNSPGLSVAQSSYGWVPVPGTSVYLRVAMDFNAGQGLCSYSFDNTNWATLGGQFNLAYDLSLGTFQGEKYALFCYNTNASTGYVDVDYFHFANNIQRGRPHLNAARTTLVADDGQPLRGPYTSTEWTAATPAANLANLKNLGFNAVHLYAEDFNTTYPASGTAPGYAEANVDAIVAATATNGLYLIITIGNGANNGNYNLAWATNFWGLYAARYANQTHVLYEIQNEPVAWGPPYSSSSATPTGAINLETSCYKIIRANAPGTPVLLFTYSVLGGTGGASAALTDIQAFNTNVFGNANAVWTNEAVAFHGYAGWQPATIAASNLLSAGYPCFMTEHYDTLWGSPLTILDVQFIAQLERLGISWLTFLYVPPSGVSADVTQPQSYANVINWTGLSWNPDYGNFPPARGTYANNGLPWTTPDFANNTLGGTVHVEAENFDAGGKGVAYGNGNSTNPGGQYRTNDTVGIEITTDAGGGYDVGWTTAGDWLEYTINVSEPGLYNLKLRVASTRAGSLQVLAGGSNGTNLTGTWTLPNTGGSQTWSTVTNTVFLRPGQQVLHFNVLAGGFNLNWLELTPVSSGSIANGSYKLLNQGSGLALQGVTSSGVLAAGGYSGSTLQQWNLSHIGGNLYEITAVADGYSWSANGDGDAVGFVWWWGAGGNQCFYPQPTGNGYYRFLPVLDGLSVEATATNSTVVDEAIYSGNASQQWGIVAPSAPPFPTGLSAAYAAATQVSLAWNAVPGAASYNVKRATTSGGPYTNLATGILAPYDTDPVPAGVKYYYVVSAVASGGGESLNSAEASPAQQRAYLAFNESSGTTAADATGNGWNGTLVNTTGATNWVAGKYGNAVDLNGVSQYVTLPASVVNGLSNITIAAWVNLDAASTWSRIFDFGTGTANYMYLTPDSSAGVVRFAITSSSGEQAITGSAALPTKTWTQVALTLGGSLGILYVNGVEVGRNSSLTVTPSSLGATTQNYIGKSQWSDPYLNGRVDDFRIYSEALSATAVATLYTQPPLATTPPATPTGLEASVASSLQLNLAWTAPTNATSYNLKRSLTSGGPYTVLAGLGATNYYDFGLAPGTAYYYVVSAVNSAGESANSLQAAATTLPAALGSLIHRYAFSETNGTTVADSIGGTAWNGTLPNGGTFSGGQLMLASNLLQYVNLPAGIISTSFMSAVTIETWSTFDTNLPWASWFFGFGTTNGSGGDCLFCSEGGGRFAASGLLPSYLGETNAYATGLNWSGNPLHLACVFNPPGGYLAIYTNGVLAGTNRSGSLTMAAIADACSFINRSLYAGDPYVNLTLDEFRIYSAALSATEIAATDVLGPDSVMSTNTPALATALSGTNLVFNWPLGNAGYVLQSRTNLASGNWGAVTSPAPQLVSGQWQVTLPPATAGGNFFRLMK